MKEHEMKKAKQWTMRSGRPMALFMVVLAAALFCGCPQARDPQSYIEELRAENADKRQRAVDELIRMGEEAVPPLIKALGSPEPQVREGALQALGGTHSLEALEAVAEVMKNPDPRPSVRIAAIQAMSKLAELRKRTAVELLETALRQEKDMGCVKAAAEGLRDLHYPDATWALMQALKQGEGLAAVFSAQALYEEDRLPEAAQFLIDGLFSSDPEIKSAAAMCINELADTFVDELLKAETTRQDAGPVRQAIVEIRNRLFEELEGNLMPERTQQIMRALGKVADSPSVERLMEVVTGEKLSISVRVEAALALGEAALSERCPGAVRNRILSFLVENHRNEKLDIKVRIACAISLCKLHNRDGVEYLLAQLSEQKEADAELRIAAQEALSASGDFVVPFLKERLRDPNAGPTMCWAAAKTLGELHVEESVPQLIELLSRPGPPIVQPEKSEEEGAEPKPVEDFRYPPYVRWTAAIALGQIGGQEALDGLREALKREKNRNVIFYIKRSIKNITAEKE